MNDDEYEAFYNTEIIPASQALATRIIEGVRSEEGPVVWLMGNAYLPPARSFPEFEYFWNHPDNEDGVLAEAFWFAVTARVADADVELFTPEYDNAIYGVNLARWEYVDSDEAFDDLNDEWQRRS